MDLLIAYLLGVATPFAFLVLVSLFLAKAMDREQQNAERMGQMSRKWQEEKRRHDGDKRKGSETTH